jgi:hypothetical protein
MVQRQPCLGKKPSQKQAVEWLKVQTPVLQKKKKKKKETGGINYKNRFFLNQVKQPSKSMDFTSMNSAAHRGKTHRKSVLTTHSLSLLHLVSKVTRQDL